MRKLYLIMAVILAVFIISITPRSAAAFSSVNACASDPSCAAALGLEAAYNSAAATTSGSAIAAGATVAAPNIVVPAAFGAAGAVVVGGAAYSVLPWGEGAAQDYANSATFDPAATDGAWYPGGMYIKWIDGFNSYGGPDEGLPYLGYEIFPENDDYRVGGPGIRQIQCNGTPVDAVSSYKAGSIEVVSLGGACPDYTGPGPFAPDPATIPDFAPGPAQPYYHPLVDPDPNVDGDEYYAPSVYTPPNDEPFLWLNPDTGLPEWRTGPQAIPAPVLGPDNQPNPVPEPNDENSADPNLSGEYEPEPDIQPATFDKPHFIPHAMSVFSTKFPLDIIGDLPSLDDISNNCPVFSFWGNDYEACVVKALLTAVKAPVILGFVIWAFMSL